MGLAEKIYIELKSKGVEIGNASIMIIDKILEDHPNCTATERAFLDELREKAKKMPLVDAWRIQRNPNILERSILFQSDFDKVELKELVNDQNKTNECC